MSRHQTAFFAIVATAFGAASISGCGLIHSDSIPKTGFLGDECLEVRQSEYEVINHSSSSVDRGAHLNLTDRERVLLSICPELHFENPKGPSGQTIVSTQEQRFSFPAPEAIHASLQFRRARMIDLGTFIFSVLTRYRYDDHSQKNIPFEQQTLSPPPLTLDTTPPLHVALAAVYARLIDERALDQELGQLGLSADAAQSYKSTLRIAIRRLDAYVAAQKPAVKKVGYDIPLRVAMSLRDQLAATRPLADRLDALMPEVEAARNAGKPNSPVGLKLEQLRTDVLTACGSSEECTYHPLYVEITQELAALYLAAKMIGPARAEYEVLSRDLALKGTFQVAIYLAQRDALSKKSKELEGIRGEQFFGADPRAHTPQSLTEGVDGGREEGYIQAITRSGEKALVSFATKTETVEVESDCVSTGRVDHVSVTVTNVHEFGSASGNQRFNLTSRPVYEEKCQYHNEQRALPKPKPTQFSQSESASLTMGERLLFDSSSSGMYVIESVRVNSDGTRSLLQLRGDRIRPAAKSSLRQ